MLKFETWAKTSLDSCVSELQLKSMSKKEGSLNSKGRENRNIGKRKTNLNQSPYGYLKYKNFKKLQILSRESSDLSNSVASSLFFWVFSFSFYSYYFYFFAEKDAREKQLCAIIHLLYNSTTTNSWFWTLHIGKHLTSERARPRAKNTTFGSIHPKNDLT